METPSSSTRVTRSHTLAAFSNSVPLSKGKNEEFAPKTRKRNWKKLQERSALNELTNDSLPIVGVAMETPSSGVGKQRSNGGKNNLMMMTTPSCGEALLRGQVNTLLQKVEEKAELSKIPLESRPFIHLQSPMALLVPTPANTPQVPNLSEDGGLGSTVMDLLPVVGEQLNISEMARGSFHGMSVETQKSAITRSLLPDFAEKSYTGESSATKEKTDDDIDNTSVWSIQVKGSTHDEDEGEQTFEETGDDYYEEDDIDDDGLVDELCEGLSKISMTGMFTGKHRRFVNNSDGEIEGEEECGGIEDFFNSYHTLEGIANTKRKAPALPSRGGAGLTQLFSLIFFGWPSFLTPSAYFIL